MAVAIVRGDHVAYLGSYGKADSAGRPVTPQTPFQIGSTTKSFTALAVMQLVEAGMIELDAPVQTYLPWFRVADAAASAQITIRHLLNQTSGLSTATGRDEFAVSDLSDQAIENSVRALADVELTATPGTTYQYCNSNFTIAGLVVQVVSGQSYESYMQAHIFDPLEMRHTFTAQAPAEQDGLATGYVTFLGIPVRRNTPFNRGGLPNGYIFSSAEDLAHYLIAQLNGGRYGDVQVLSSAGVEELHRGAAEIREMGMEIGSYGMGWVSQVTGTSTIVSHSGIVPDFGAFAGLVPDQKKGIVLLYNANHAMVKMTFDEFGLGAAERLAGEVPAKTFFGAAPWLMRSTALIPILQVLGVVLTLRRLRRWRADPAGRPSGSRLWGQHILLPLVPNLLVALTLAPLLSKMRGWMLLFMPDFSWIAHINGAFAALWACLRTALIVRGAKAK